jgi:hypothetical protein
MKGFGSIFDNPIHTTPLFVSPPNPIQVLGIFIVGNSLIIHHDMAVSSFSQGVLLFMSGPIRQSQKSRYIKRRMIKVLTANGVTQNITDYYTLVYGQLPVPGNYISIEIGLYSDTLKTFSKSPPVQVEVI